MKLAELAAVASAVAATASRSVKIDLIAVFLRRLDAGETGLAVAFLAGIPPEGKIGVGWSKLTSIRTVHSLAPQLEIADLAAAFEAVRSTTGTGSGSARSSMLGDLFSRATHDEADFIRRFLVGELRHGALAGVVTDAIAKAADVPSSAVRRAAMFCGDLSLVAEIASSHGRAGLDAVTLQLLRPIQPMLASSAASVEDAIRVAGESSVEHKLDGIRIQVHKTEDAVRIFTRNLNDITERCPEIVSGVGSLNAHSLVLDGEALPSQQSSLVPYFFDLLHRDGQTLTDVALGTRRAMLGEVAPGMTVPSSVTADPVEAGIVLDEALAAGHEGVVVKSIGSSYQAGRRGKAWLKVKLVQTFDLVIIAAEWGHGRRRGWLSNIHLGARGPDGRVLMVGKTFKGFTDQMLAWQTARLLELETGRDGIVVHVEPELVVEIALDGVQVSTRYTGGIALRFARVKRFRSDKSPSDIDTIDALRRLVGGSDDQT